LFSAIQKKTQLKVFHADKILNLFHIMSLSISTTERTVLAPIEPWGVLPTPPSPVTTEVGVKLDRTHRPLSTHPLTWRPPAAESVAAVEALLQSASFMAGIRLGQEQVLAQRLEQRLQQTLTLGSIADEFARVYEEATKREYQKHGMTFTYAEVSRRDMPYLIAIGSAGMRFGDMLFVVGDFFPDIDADTRSKVNEMIAVHEYGERVFNDHHEASQLEFAVAQADGFLEKYLEFLSDKYLLKFRDVAGHRMLPRLQEKMKRGAVKIKQSDDLPLQTVLAEDDSVRSARALRAGFQWPAELLARYGRDISRDAGTKEEEAKVQEWAKVITDNQQIGAQLSAAVDAVMLAAPGLERLPEESRPAALRANYYIQLRNLYEEIQSETLTVPANTQTLDLFLEQAAQRMGWNPGSWYEVRAILKKQEGILSEASRISRVNLSDDNSVQRFMRTTWRQAAVLLEKGVTDTWPEALEMSERVRRMREHLDGYFKADHWTKLLQPILEAPTRPAAIARMRATVRWEVAQALATQETEMPVPDFVAQEFIDRTFEQVRDADLSIGWLMDPIEEDFNLAALRDERGSYRPYLVDANQPQAVYENYLLDAARASSDPVVQGILAQNLAALWAPRTTTHSRLGFESTVVRATTEGRLSDNMAQRVLQARWETRPPRVNVISDELLKIVGRMHRLSPAQLEALNQYTWLSSPFISLYVDNPTVMAAYRPRLGAFAPLMARIEAEGLEAVFDDIDVRFGNMRILYDLSRDLVLFQDTQGMQATDYRDVYLSRAVRTSLADFETGISDLDESALIALHRNLKEESSTIATSLDETLSNQYARATMAIGRRVGERASILEVTQEAIRFLGNVGGEITSEIENHVSHQLDRLENPTHDETLPLADILVGKMTYDRPTSSAAHRLFERVAPTTRMAEEETAAWHERVLRYLGQSFDWYDDNIEAYLRQVAFATHSEDVNVLLAKLISRESFSRFSFYPDDNDNLWNYLFGTAQGVSPENRSQILRSTAQDILRQGIRRLDAISDSYQSAPRIHDAAKQQLSDEIGVQLQSTDLLGEVNKAVDTDHMVRTAIAHLPELHLEDLGSRVTRRLNARATEDNVHNLRAVAHRIPASKQHAAFTKTAARHAKALSM